MVVYCFVVSGLLWMGHSIADRLDWATVPLVLCIYLFTLIFNKLKFLLIFCSDGVIPDKLT